jgi:hypothetical protein
MRAILMQGLSRLDGLGKGDRVRPRRDRAEHDHLPRIFLALLSSYAAATR